MRFIEHIVESDRLLLSWQSSMTNQSRQRMFVGQLVRTGDDDANLAYLKDSEEFSKAQALGFDGYPGFALEKDVHKNVLASFMKRLPPRKRGDFDRFLAALRIKPDAEISDFALLGYSGAKLPDDDFTVVNPFENASGPFEFMLPVQGYRYYTDKLPRAALTTDMQARFDVEPDNPQDPEAIRIVIGDATAGYVCRGLTVSFHKWMQLGWTISAYIERINGPEQKPEIYLYVLVK